MAKNDYLDSTDGGFSTQLNTCKNALPGYLTVLNISPAAAASQAQDALYYAYCLASQTVVQNYARQQAVWKNLIRDGGPLPPTVGPVAPTMPAPIPAALAKWTYEAIYRIGDQPNRPMEHRDRPHRRRLRMLSSFVVQP